MGNYITKEINNKEVWESYLLRQDPKSFLQSWNWGETNKFMGEKIYRIGFFDNSKLIGICLAIKQNAKRGPHLIVPGGPLINWSDKKLVRFFLKSIKELGLKEKAWFIRIRPEIPDGEKTRKAFQKAGFLSAPMHLHAENTWVLDITRSEQDLLVGMRKGTRYLVRKSLNVGMSLEITKDINKTILLKKLQNETSERHGFVGFPLKLFKAQLETFGKDNEACLFICRKDNIPLVAAIIIFYGNCAYYHHSASSEKSREIPASYFLQWCVIKEAKKRGCQYYNFWGIAPTDDPGHRFAGVTLFKKGFGGNKIDWLHAQDLVISPLYHITRIFETARRIFRRL